MRSGLLLPVLIWGSGNETETYETQTRVCTLYCHQTPPIGKGTDATNNEMSVQALMKRRVLFLSKVLNNAHFVNCQFASHGPGLGNITSL